MSLQCWSTKSKSTDIVSTILAITEIQSAFHQIMSITLYQLGHDTSTGFTLVYHSHSSYYTSLTMVCGMPYWKIVVFSILHQTNIFIIENKTLIFILKKQNSEVGPLVISSDPLPPKWAGAHFLVLFYFCTLPLSVCMYASAKILTRTNWP